MERASICDIAGHPRQIRDLVGQRKPLAMKLINRGMRRRRDWVSFLDQRVQVNHLLVIMEEVEDDLPRNTRWKRRNSGEDGTFRHGVVRFRVSDDVDQ